MTAPVHTGHVTETLNQQLNQQLKQNPLNQMWDKFRIALREHFDDEGGMSTIEYALGCVAAAALGALLYTVVTSGAVESALSGIFERALNQSGK